jgi:hypothetical protein
VAVVLANFRQNKSAAVVAKVSKKEAQRLQKTIDKLWEHVVNAMGVESYEAFIASIKTAFQNPNTSPAAWIHGLARARARELFPADETDSLQPEQFYAILGLIDTREKAYRILLRLPEEAVPRIDRLLDFMMKELLTAIRSQAQAIVDEFPSKRGGGPKTSSMPSFAVCREICETIQKLHSKDGVAKGLVQQQMKDRYNLSLRMVQRIWHDRKKYLS